MFSLVSIVRSLGITGLLLSFGVGAYAFTASNTVPTSKAGDGSGTISGYTLSAIHYGLNATTPTNVDSVSFTVDAAPVSGSTMKVQINSSWYTCTNVTTTVTCTTTSPQLTIANSATLEALIAN